MQRTCSRCGGLLAPGATVCSYCGQPAPDAYSQQNYPPPTQYSSYSPTAGATDPYAAQYGTQAAPPPPATVASAPAYGQPAYGAPPAAAFGPPVQQPPFGVGSQPPPFQTPPQPPAKKSSAPVIGIILAIIVVLAGLGVGGYFLFGKGNNSPIANATATPGPLYTNNLTSDPGGWDCSATQCSFRSDGYHVQAPDDFVYTTFLTTSFTDAVIQVKSVISSGKTSGDSAGEGISFRVPQSNKLAGYGLLVYSDGKYGLVKWDAKGNATALIAIDTSSSAIHLGLNQENDLKLVIKGNTFTVFINGQQVNEVSDSTYASGYIGLSAADKGAEVIYSHLLITKP